MDSSSPDIYDLLGDAYTQAEGLSERGRRVPQGRRGGSGRSGPPARPGAGAAGAGQIRGSARAIQEADASSSLAQRTIICAWRSFTAGSANSTTPKRACEERKQLAPGSLEVLYNEALLYEDQGRYDDAVKVLNDAIAGIKEPGRQRGQLRTLWRFSTSNWGTPTANSRNIPRRDPDVSRKWKSWDPIRKSAREMLLIETYRDSHDIDHAIAEAKKALDASPNDPNSDHHRSRCSTAISPIRPRQRKSCKDCCRETTSDQEIYIDIAQVQERGKKYADAEQSAQKAEQMAQRARPTRRSAWFMLGAIYERQKKFDQAEQQFRKVLDANPNNAPVLNYLRIHAGGPRHPARRGHFADPAGRAAGSRTTAHISTAWAGPTTSRTN